MALLLQAMELNRCDLRCSQVSTHLLVSRAMADLPLGNLDMVLSLVMELPHQDKVTPSHHLKDTASHLKDTANRLLKDMQDRLQVSPDTVNNLHQDNMVLLDNNLLQDNTEPLANNRACSHRRGSMVSSLANSRLPAMECNRRLVLVVLNLIMGARKLNQAMGSHNQVTGNNLLLNSKGGTDSRNQVINETFV